jgi:hypothetical protein
MKAPFLGLLPGLVLLLALNAIRGRAAAVTTLPSVRSAARITDPDAQKYMLALARLAFDTYAISRDVIEPPSPVPAFLAVRSGVFVSTMRHGAPRTCMGTLYPMQPNLAEEIIANAVASAGRDRRFAPVRPDELAGLDLIVSIVSDPEPISESAAESLDPAAQALAVKVGDRYGVVLSGETFSAATMVRWGRIRAGAGPSDAAQYFVLHDIRFMESQFSQ